VAGELKETGQTLLTTHAYAYALALCRQIHTHTVVRLRAEHWAY